MDFLRRYRFAIAVSLGPKYFRRVQLLHFLLLGPGHPRRLRILDLAAASHGLKGVVGQLFVVERGAAHAKYLLGGEIESAARPDLYKLAEEKNPVHVKESLGHSDLRTTMGYTHLSREHLRSLVDEPERGPGHP